MASNLHLFPFQTSNDVPLNDQEPFLENGLKNDETCTADDVNGAVLVADPFQRMPTSPMLPNDRKPALQYTFALTS